MLVDERTITVKGGDGGRGKVSFGKHIKSGPDGGNGGDGGKVYVKSSSDLTLLGQFHEDEIVTAEDGGHGGRKNMAGKKGESITILLPIGSHLLDLDTKDEFELEKPGEEFLLCEGGKGGIGNFDQRSSTNTTPKHAIPPVPPQTRRLHIVMKFIADYGLIGLPSAGKSSLLNELTNANVKTAAYHFTTLSPNLGVLSNRKIIADIPGLIEGAHEGKGLGIKFLKHIEKVGLLLHCISSDSLEPLNDYETIRNELEEYNPDMLQKDEVILLTKTDLVDKKELEEKLTKLGKLGKKLVPVSIYDNASIAEVAKIL